MSNLAISNEHNDDGMIKDNELYPMIGKVRLIRRSIEEKKAEDSNINCEIITSIDNNNNNINKHIQRRSTAFFPEREAYLNIHYDKEIPIEITLKEELLKPAVKRVINPYVHYTKKTPQEILSSIQNESRNINKISYCLHQLKGMNHFIKFNCINETTLQKAIIHMKYEFHKANQCLFKQGDSSTQFYGIISGKVAIKSKKVIKKKFEEDTMTYGPGMCFGEWAIIYNDVRKSSAYTITDTQLFTLDKDSFDLTLSKEIIKADNDKKNFVTKKIPALMNRGKTQNILSQIIPQFYNSGDVVYSEFDTTDFIYVLYQGECILTKFIHPELIEDALLHREKMITLFKVDKGGILGLEAIYPNTKYITNLLVTRNYTVLYQINLAFLKECYVSTANFLRPMYNLQNDLINSAMKKEMIMITNRKMKSMSRNQNQSAENIFTQKTVELIKEMGQKKKSPDKNTLKISMEQKKITIDPNLFHSKMKYAKSKYGIYTSLRIVGNERSKTKKTSCDSTLKEQCSMTHRKFMGNELLKLSILEGKTLRESQEKKMNSIKKNIFSIVSYRNRSLKKQQINSSTSNIFKYNSGSFDLPLVATNSLRDDNNNK